MPPTASCLRVTSDAVQRWDPSTHTVSAEVVLQPDVVAVQPATASLTVARVTGLDDSRITSDADAVTVAYHRSRTQYKVPVHACGTENVVVAALSTGSVIDDVTLAAGDRVLLRGQEDPDENGIYVVGATPGTTVRANDMPSGSHAFGMLVYALTNPKPLNASLNANRFYLCTSNTAVRAGEAPILFDEVNLSGGGHGLGASLVHVRAAALAPVDPVPPPAGTVLDGTVALATGDWVLLTAQTDPVANGLYVVGGDRAPGLVANGVTDASGAVVFVTEGAVAGGRLYLCTNPTAGGMVGTDALTFVPVAHAPPHLAAEGLVVDNARQALAVDFAVVPGLARGNTFTGAANTFAGRLVVGDATPATSQSAAAVVVAGGLAVGGSVYCASTYNMSDAQLKDDVRPVENATDLLEGVRGCTFRWNKHPDNVRHGRADTWSLGCIAQDVHAAGGAAALCVGRDPHTGLLAVDYPKLVPLLLEGLRDVRRRCDNLERTRDREPKRRRRCRSV